MNRWMIYKYSQQVYTICIKTFTVRKFHSYSEILSVHENLPVCNIGILYQDLQDVLDDNLYSKYYYTIATQLASS